MLFYTSLFIAAIILVMIANQYKRLGIVLLIILCFISSFRGESVGTDTATYMDINRGIDYYERYRSGNDNAVFFSGELLYVSVLYFIRDSNLDHSFIIVFFSVTTFVFLFLSAKRTSAPLNYVLLLFLLFYYLMSFNIARQITAMTVVLYAYTFLLKEKPKILSFLFFVLVATMIHTSMLVSLAALGILFIKIKKRFLITMLMVLTLINCMLPISFIQFISVFFPDNYYVSTYEDINMATSLNIMGKFNFVANSLFYIYFLSKYSNNKIASRNDKLFALSILIYSLTAFCHSDIARISFPLMIYQVLYISKYIKEHPSSVITICFIFYHLFFRLYYTSLNTGGVLPYEFSSTFFI